VSAREALGHAFDADPLFTYLVPDAARRARFLPWYAGAIIRLGRRVGVVDAATVTPGAGVAGVAVWLQPGHTTPPLSALVRARLLPGLPLRLGPAGFVRYVRFAWAAEGLHRRTVPGPHWYLLLLGVDPARQRKGLGTALVRAGLARAAGCGGRKPGRLRGGTLVLVEQAAEPITALHVTATGAAGRWAEWWLQAEAAVRAGRVVVLGEYAQHVV
jgi:ribosomal protein S18 acetylase RimI-like enzyme